MRLTAVPVENIGNQQLVFFLYNAWFYLISLTNLKTTPVIQIGNLLRIPIRASLLYTKTAFEPFLEHL